MSQSQNYYGNSGGGGFMSPGNGYGGSPASGGPGTPANNRTEASQSTRPLTIAQILKATQAHTDAEWKVEDIEIGHITVVAQVVHIQRQSTNCVYSIEDGTGKIEARHWIDSTSNSSEDDGKWGGVEPNKYARVVGILKTFGTKRYINATSIRPVTDPHEIYFHILESIAVGLILEKGLSPDGGANMLTGIHQTNPAVHMYAPSASSKPKTNTANNSDLAGFAPIERSIIDFILDQPRASEGVHVAAIARAIGGDANAISVALEKLMDDGHVFTTVDDSHFAVST